MIHLDLTESDVTALIKVLDYYISELRMEVTGTDRKDLRDELKVEEEILKKVLQTFRQKLGKA